MHITLGYVREILVSTSLLCISLSHGDSTWYTHFLKTGNHSHSIRYLWTQCRIACAVDRDVSGGLNVTLGCLCSLRPPSESP